MELVVYRRLAHGRIALMLSPAVLVIKQGRYDSKSEKLREMGRNVGSGQTTKLA